jgi:hypothetical protein
MIDMEQVKYTHIFLMAFGVEWGPHVCDWPWPHLTFEALAVTMLLNIKMSTLL